MCDPLLSAIEHGTQATESVVMERAVYNHWTELVDWTGGLTLKIKTHLPVGLHMLTPRHAQSDLMPS